MALSDRLATVFEKTFGFPRASFSAATGPEQVPNWDSIGHMNLVGQLEQEFGIQFDVDEIMEMGSAARIAAILQARGVTD
jgi:acyl carrier protein